MQVLQELDLRVFDSGQDEVQSALNGGMKEVRELHALDWTSEPLGGSLEQDGEYQTDSQHGQAEVRIGTKKWLADSLERVRSQIFED